MIIRKNNLLSLDSRNNCTSISSRHQNKEEVLPKLDIDNTKIYLNIPSKNGRNLGQFQPGQSVPSVRGFNTDRTLADFNTAVDIFPLDDKSQTNPIKVKFQKQANKINSITNAFVPFQSVQNLVKLIQDRKKTFVKFAFKSVEYDEERNLWPFVRDFLGKESKGSMFVSELWSNENISRYVRQANFLSSKRLVKRLATTSKVKRNENKNQVMTSKEELLLKIKISSRSQASLQEDISKKFQSHQTIIKLIENQLIDPVKLTKVKSNKANFDDQVIKAKNKSVDKFPSQKKMKMSIIPTQEKMIINNLIDKIDDVLDDTQNDKKYLDILLVKLRDQIVNRRAQKSLNSVKSMQF